jgi:condensin complex subunit 3
LKEIVVQVLVDLVITHPSLLAPPEPDPEASAADAEPKTNALIKPLTKVLLKAFHSDEKSISLMACTAASKLLLLGILPPAAMADIIKAFTLTYFDPETAHNPALRQALSYFLPVFCHSKLKNALLMAQIAVPIVSKLLLMREDMDEDADDMVSWTIITGHLSEWTDGRKVVGTTEQGLDGKTSTALEAEEPHITLASEILERALTNTCSKDERKPLLSLLSKLHVASSGPAPDEEALRSLHGLVTEAVEGKLGMDVTQRNYLTKLELGLTKRLGDVEHVTQMEDGDENENDNTVMPDATELPVRQKPNVGEEEEEEEDTMLANMQGEGTRMPLEEEEEEDSSDVTVGSKRPAVTESDIMEDLLASEMDES